MKAVLSNRIYLSVDPTHQEYVDKELTYSIPSHDPRDPPITIKNMGTGEIVERMDNPDIKWVAASPGSAWQGLVKKICGK